MSQSPAAGSAARNQYGTFAVHTPSPAQLAFVARLVESKGTGDADGSFYQDFREGRMNKKAASRYIDHLLALPDLPKVGTPTGRPATAKQLGFLRRLFAERDAHNGLPAAECIAVLDRQVEAGTVTSQLASAQIEKLMAAPRRGAATPDADAELEAGMYRTGDGTLVRVYLGRQSGKMLAKKIVGSVEAGYSFEYMGMAARFVTAAERMSLDEAKAWGRVTESCCVCAAHLDDPDSVKAGIGPVCAKRV